MAHDGAALRLLIGDGACPKAKVLLEEMQIHLLPDEEVSVGQRIL